MYSTIDIGLLSWLKREFDAIRRGFTSENVTAAALLEKRIKELEDRVRALES